MTRVVSILLVGFTETVQLLDVDVDAARWAAWIVLAHEEKNRNSYVGDVRHGIAARVLLGHLGRRPAKECRVVLLQRLHLVLVRGDVVADGNDAEAERPR